MSAQPLLNGLYIDGQWLAGSEHLQVINPSTEGVLAQVAGGGPEAVEQALCAASAGLCLLYTSPSPRD